MNGADEANGSKAPRLGTARIMLVLLIIAVVIELVTIVSWYVFPQNYDDAEYDYDEYFAGADASNRGGIEYLSDDEVKDIGLPCTELDHFDFSYESLLDDITGIIKDLGLDISDTEISSYNQIYGDGGSWYETLLTYYLAVPGDETAYQRITLNYDTATGALHEIDLFISDKECLIGLCSALLEMLGERTETFDRSLAADAVETITRSVERGENMYASFGTADDLAVTLYCFDDGYSVYIGRE